MPIEVLVPIAVWQEDYGICRHCLDFHYDAERMSINKWPKAVLYKEKTYVRTGYNTDSNIVHFKEGEVAFPVKVD